MKNSGRYVNRSNSRNSSSSDASVSSSSETGESDDLEKNDSIIDLRSHTKSNGIQMNMKVIEPKSISNSVDKLQNNISHSKVTHISNDRLDDSDFNALRNSSTFAISPKTEEKHINKIKRECQKNDLTTIDEKVFNKLNYNGDTKNTSANIKREHDKIKIENGNDDGNSAQNNIQMNRKKRTSSVNSSPYKEKKRKKMFEDATMEEHLLLPNNHDRTISDVLPPPPPPQKPLITKMYYSYFERANDDRDEIRDMK